MLTQLSRGFGGYGGNRIINYRGYGGLEAIKDIPEEKLMEMGKAASRNGLMWGAGTAGTIALVSALTWKKMSQFWKYASVASVPIVFFFATGMITSTRFNKLVAEYNAQVAAEKAAATKA